MTRLLAAPALLALIALPMPLWPLAIFAVAVASAMGLGAWVWSLRRRLAAKTELAETFADELAAEQRRSNAADKTIVRLVGEKLRLSNDLLAAHKRISDAENVIPLPVRDGADLAALDAEATAYTWPSIAREAFPVREWGEEAEK